MKSTGAMPAPSPDTLFADPNQLFLVPLGGAGEIGMNLNVYGYGGEWMIVDLGVSFGDDSMPSIDVFMADPAFIEERRDRLAGIVLTHGHEDHLGAVAYLWPRLRCPVYATPFAAAILESKLQEAGLGGQVPVKIVQLGARFSVGPFDVELITLTHSIPEPNALAIRTPAGTVLHTGDWKFDPDPLIGEAADFEALRRVGAEGVVALVGDSTNVFVPGEGGSEADVRKSLAALLGQYGNRIAVACFASNVARLESIALAAQANGRHTALVGRSLWKIDAAARRNGYLKDLPPFLDGHDAAYLPKDKVVYICTGSQGEPRAALARIASGDHPHVTLGEGDVAIFSSRIIPGNERAINELQNKLVRRGVELVTEKDHFVHVSGHPGRDELARMYQTIRPRVAVPVHGEARHLVEHARLARSCQVPRALVVENGSIVKLAPGEAEVVGTAPFGRLAVDGNRLVSMDSELLRRRHRMMWSGNAVVTLALDRMGRLLGDPQVSAHGLIDPDLDQFEQEQAADAIREAVEDLPQKARQDDAVVKETARVALRRALKASYGKKPMTDVHLVRL